MKTVAVTASFAQPTAERSVTAAVGLKFGIVNLPFEF